MRNLSTIKSGEVTRENNDKIVIDHDGYRVVIGKQLRDNKGNVVDLKNWVITSFDRNRPEKEKTPSEKTLTTPPLDPEAAGMTLPTNGVSDNKDTNKKLPIGWGNSSPIPLTLL